MKIFRVLSVAFLFSCILAACSSMTSGTSANTKVIDGTLVGANNMTLYVFDKDQGGSGKSTCNGPCAANWPPLLVEVSASAYGDFTVITRDDGKRQLAYKGRPLYFWTKDVKPGDKTGDGFLNGAWHIVKM